MELPYINHELGIGRSISKDDLLFDEEQIEKIGLKPIIQDFTNTHMSNLKKELNKGFGISICQRIHTIEPTLTKVKVAEIVSEMFNEMDIKLNSETILKWKWQIEKQKND